MRDTLTSGEGRGYIVTSCPSSLSVKSRLSIFAESRRREMASSEHCSDETIMIDGSIMEGVM